MKRITIFYLLILLSGFLTQSFGQATDLFISEYSEGSSNNKYVELYNGTGAAVDLANYRMHKISNGGDWDENIFPLSGTLNDGEVYVIANASADPYILGFANITNNSLCNFNGDDAVGLAKNIGGTWTMIDAVGEEGPDPGSGWDVAGTSNATKDHTLVRKNDVCSPTMDWAASAGTDPANSEWIVHPKNTWTYLGSHTANCGGGQTVATPVFSHFSGNYFAAFDLTITCSTENSTIYYTTDGTDPDQGSTEYTALIPIGTTTTVKARAYATGYDPSSIAEAEYVFPVVTEVATIAELRAAPQGDYYKITGEVVITFQQSWRGQKYIQDATAAILIDDNAGIISTAYDLYDGITDLTGILGEYGNMLQFYPAVDPGAPSSTANVIVPEVITINDMVNNFEEYEAELVQILDATFTSGGNIFENGAVYEITDVSKATGNFRATFFDVDYIGTEIPYFPVYLTGLCNSRTDGDYITSRFSADIELAPMPPTLLVTSPNGGEQIEQGTNFDITWDYINFDGNIKIELLAFGAPVAILLAENIPVTEESWSWDVTQDFGDEYKIIISDMDDGDPMDESDNFFAIVPPIKIVITEIMYNPPESGTDTLEYIEFYNNGDGVVNFEYWEITQGVGFTFPEYLLNPGEYVIVCKSADAFLNTFGEVVFEWESGSLGNSGEDIELTDNAGFVRAFVDYDDGGEWPSEPDGEGPSLTFCDPDLENNIPANWSVSTLLAAINADGEGIYCTPLMGCNTEPVLATMYPYGWGGISSNIIQAKISMEDLFAPAYGNLIILIGQSGVFWPGQNINTLGDWDTYQGYKIKFDGSTYFVFQGTEPENRTLTLDPGIFYIPVLSAYPVSVEELIVPLGNDIEFMFDIYTGEVYWPAGGIVPGTPGALELLNPGISYLTRVNNPVFIDFGSIPPKFSPETHTVEFVNNTNWNDVARTGGQHIISILPSAFDVLESGDVIGVFDKEGACTGMIEFSGNSTALPLIVFEDDPTTGVKDGMNTNEFMEFRIYRQGGNTMNFTPVYDETIYNHNGLFVSNGLSIISNLKAGATGINDLGVASISIYPNPNNGQFMLNLNTESNFTLIITNSQGQEIYSAYVNTSQMLDLSNQPKGVYFIKLTNEISTTIEKIVIR